MANRDIPRGAWPIRSHIGGEVRVSKHDIDTSDGTLITRGDFVKMEADGNITRAANNETYLGVFSGCEYADADGNVVQSDQVPATKTNFTRLSDGLSGVDAYVYDDPFMIFGMQADGNTVETDTGAVLPIVAAAGNTTTKLSAFEVDTTGGTGADVKVIGKIDRPDNAWGTNVDLEVMINDHLYLHDTSGV
jgi:hypothetical protein|tara:strand:+ start:321 stop:893 length:573 start_codon:yes stop_codon:yes gene_type:complete